MPNEIQDRAFQITRLIVSGYSEFKCFQRVKDFCEGNAENSLKSMRYEVLRMVKMLILVFWVVTMHSTLKRWRHFVPLKHWSEP